jgi:hypothetical protein
VTDDNLDTDIIEACAEAVDKWGHAQRAGGMDGLD